MTPVTIGMKSGKSGTLSFSINDPKKTTEYTLRIHLLPGQRITTKLPTGVSADMYFAKDASYDQNLPFLGPYPRVGSIAEISLGTAVREITLDISSSEDNYSCYNYKAGQDANWCKATTGFDFTHGSTAYKGCNGCWCCEQTGTNKVKTGEEFGYFGGYCTCPDGTVYGVGDGGTNCASIECEGGTAGTCTKESGLWSYRKVTCADSSSSTSATSSSGPTLSELEAQLASLKAKESAKTARSAGYDTRHDLLTRLKSALEELEEGL